MKQNKNQNHLFRFGKATAAKGTISVFDRGLHVSDTFSLLRMKNLNMAMSLTE